MQTEEHYWRHVLPLHKLRDLCAAEKERGRQGHWTFVPARQWAMARIYRERLAATQAPATETRSV